MKVNDKTLYYTRAFRRRDPDGKLQSEVERLLAAQVVRSFEGKADLEDSSLEELALAAITVVIDQIASWGKIFYHGPMLETVRQTLWYLRGWRKTLASKNVPSGKEADEAGAALLMIVLWQLFSEYVIDHPQPAITVLVEVVTESEYAPDVLALLTDEPKLFVQGQIFHIYHAPCVEFGDREVGLLKDARVQRRITNFHVIDVSDAV